MSLILTGNSSTLTVDSTSGITFPNGSGAQVAPSKVLQVVQGTYATQVSTTSSTFVSTPLTASITPLFSTSKILVIATGNGGTTNTGGSVYYTLTRGITNLMGANGGNYLQNPSSQNYTGVSLSYLDSPATTSSTSYSVYFRSDSSVTAYFCLGSTTNTITLMEIAV